MIERFVATCFLLSIGSGAVAQAFTPTGLRVDMAGNEIFEPGETVRVFPYWVNGAPVFIQGGPSSLANFSGPAGATLTIVDGTGAYGLFGPMGYPPQTCSDCYSLQVNATTRPVQHWDTTVLEALWSGTITKTWTLHIGATFTDVPTTSGFYRFVETIVHKNVTGGCSETAYCPTAPISREAMAVFLLVAREPRGYTPPPCGSTPLFSDVPVSGPFCAWVEELARRGVTAGCGGGAYCPATPVTRQEMAVFILRTASPVIPASCATQPYLDVPVASPYCLWIRELTRRGVVAGCGGSNYCPTDPVTREQMSVFLTTTFGLTLYGV